MTGWEWIRVIGTGALVVAAIVMWLQFVRECRERIDKEGDDANIR